MDESEKMTALQKAYAETILNTAKEAAARIMSSERKAQHFHHDLSSTKDEALRLLLRLKHSFHAQINEAELKSINQQRRIQELEAQLQEAEDIVSSLRVELNDAHMKLEKMTNSQINNAPNNTEKVHGEDETQQLENGLSESNSINILEVGHCSANNALKEIGHSGHSVVPSVIMRSKKPELYRNGCTQRIHAYEGNLVNGHFPLSGDDQRDEKTIREDKDGEDKQDIEMKNSSPVHSVPKRISRNRKRRAARYETLNPMPFLGMEALSDLSDSQLCLSDSHDMHEGSDNKDKSTSAHSPSTVPSYVSEMGVLPRVDETIACTIVNEETEVASSLVLVRQPRGSEDCLDDSTSKQDLETKDSSSVNPDSKQLKAGDDFPSPPPRDRFLKYTFQRKRKKESLSADDSSLHQENPLKRKMVKKQNDDLEGLKSSAVAESSRDNRRVAQVARQLISLSEKKWWK